MSTRSRFLVLSIFAVLTARNGMRADTPDRPLPTPSPSAAQYRDVLDRYCVTCHNQRLRTAGLELETPDLARIAEHADLWEKVVRKLRAGTMPPQGARRPEPTASDALATWLEGRLDLVATDKRDPGRPVLHP